MVDVHKFNGRAVIGQQSGNQGLEGCLVISRKMGKWMSLVEMARHVSRNVCFTAVDAQNGLEGRVDPEPKTVQEGVGDQI